MTPHQMIEHHIALREMGMYSTLEFLAPGAISYMHAADMMMYSQNWYDLKFCLLEDYNAGNYPPLPDSPHQQKSRYHMP